MSVNPHYPYVDGGWTCGNCGAFVPNNTTHACPGWTYQPATEVKWDRMSDVRIADALERIAAALEAQNTGTERGDA